MDKFEITLDTSTSSSSKSIAIDDAELGSLSDVSLDGTSDGDISGTVVNQNGDPIEGATVEIWGVDYTQITPGDLASKKDKALQIIEDAANKTPSAWTEQVQSDFDVVTHLESADGRCVAIHEPDDWQASVFSANVRDDPNLEDPVVIIPSPNNEEVELAVSVWDTSDEETPIIGEDGVNDDLPGQPVDGQVRLEALFGGSDVMTTYTRKTSIGPGGFFSPTDYSDAYHVVSVTPGIYRAYPEENQACSYLVKVGDPSEQIAKNVTNNAGQVADQASQVAKDLTDGKFTRTTVETGEDGNWSVSVGSDVNTVAVQARKLPDNAPSDMTELSMESIIDEYGTNTSDLGSFYLSSSVRRVDPPESNVTVEMYEVTYPSGANLSNLGNQTLKDYWKRLNDTRNEITDEVQQRLEDMNDDELEEMADEMQDLVNENEELRDRYEELLEDSENLDDTTEIVINETGSDELRDRIRLLQQTIDELEETIETGDPTSTVGQNTVSLSFPFDTDLRPQQVTVLAHYSNGTTKTLSTDSEYVSIDSGLAGPLSGDVVRVTEYPLGENDAASVSFEVLVANEDGVARSSESVVNPTYTGTVPALEAIRFSTLHPGPSESVTIELIPEEPASFGSLVSVTAHQGASEITTDDVTDLTGGFDTNGTGVYHVELTFNDTDGNQFSEVVRITAESQDDKYPPTMFAASGPTGDYAVVGDGLQSGQIEVQDGGSTVSVSAVIQDSADNPGQVDVYMDSIDTNPNVVTEFSVVRGDRKEGVSTQTGVMMHVDSLSENAVIYQGDSRPIPRTGATQYGRVDVRANGTTIETFTDEDGTVSVETINNPGWGDRALYRVRLELAEFGITAPLSTAPAVGVGA